MRACVNEPDYVRAWCIVVLNVVAVKRGMPRNVVPDLHRTWNTSLRWSRLLSDSFKTVIRLN